MEDTNSTTPVVQIPQNNWLLILLVGILILVIGIAAGFLVGKYVYSPKIVQMPIPIVAASPTPVSITDPTANWKTFKIVHDPQFGFSDYEIKLSENWKQQEHSSNFQNSETFIFTKSTTKIAGGDFTPGMAWITITISDTPISQIINLDENKNSASKIVINGSEFTKLSGYGGVGGSVYYSNLLTFYKGKTYQISFSTQDDNIKNQLLKEFDQILSTFKFLDQNSDPEGKFCGGIAANLPQNQCPEGYICKMENNYPDAGGVCTKKP